MNKELVYLADLHSHTNCDIEDIDCKNIVQKSYSVLRQALTPPTEDEVIKALSEYLPLESNYYYDREKRYFGNTDLTIICLMPKGKLYIAYMLPPHLITMIGKFYESLEGDLNV